MVRCGGCAFSCVKEENVKSLDVKTDIMDFAKIPASLFKEKAPEGTVLVTVIPDTGERYVSTPLCQP